MRTNRTEPVGRVEKSPQGSQGSDPRNPRVSRVSGPGRAGEPGRFWAKVVRTESGCWLWTGAKLKSGYGRFRVWRNGRWTHMPAHRWAYEDAHGPLRAELAPDHTCHTNDRSCPGGPTCVHRGCVNPDHLEPVTHEENGRRARERGPIALSLGPDGSIPLDESRDMR